MQTSLIVTIGAIMSWAALSAVSRVLLLRLGLDPWTFSLVQLCAGGLVLLTIGGCRSLNLSSFKRPTTWLLGMLRVLSAALYTAVLVWVSVLEAGTIGSISVPMVTIAVWMIFGRRPGRGEWLGHLVILCAVVVLLVSLQGAIRYAVAGLMLSNAFCLIAIAFLAERHPDNVSDQPGVRLRFTGAVLLVTAALFFAMRLVQGDADDGTWNLQLVTVSVAVGVLLRAPSMVLSFWSIRLVGAQNYMAAISLLPLLGMVFEEAAIVTGLLDVSRFQVGTLFLALSVVAGTLMVLFARELAVQPATTLTSQDKKAP